MPSFEGKFPPEDITAAGIVAKHIDLDDISMLEGGFSLLPQKEAAPPLTGALIEMNASYDFREPENALSVRASFSVRFRPDSVPHGHGDGAVFTASAIFLLRYRLAVPPPPVEIREQLFRGFARVNGAYNAWPYLREFVQTSAARVGLLPVTMPVFRVPRVQPAGPPAPQVTALQTAAAEMPLARKKTAKRAR